MRHRFPISIMLLFTVFMSCDSHQKLSKENRVLKDSPAVFQEFSEIKSEAIVELKKMNVVYRGIDNALKIAVPNALNISVMAPGLINKGNGNFVLRPQKGKEVILQIVAQMRSGKTIKFEKVFRIEDIGDPIGVIKNKSFAYTTIKLTKKEFIKSVFSFDIYNFLHFRNLKVSEFDILFPNNKIIKVSGNTLNNEAIKQIEELEIGSKIHIHNIKGYGYSGSLKKIRSIYIEIVP